MQLDVLCLQESKCSLDKLVFFCSVFGFDDVINGDAYGKSGGLAIFWKHPLVFQEISKCKFGFMVTLCLPL